jgi:RNA polymerase sigma-70 factor (ECF subfamily)
MDDQLPLTYPVQAHELDWEQVRDALAQIEEHYQSAVALFYLEECSYKEIAEILEVPVGTVKSRLARGLGQLKKNFFKPAQTTGLESPKMRKAQHE